MHELIEKLLILQDRDRQILRLREQLMRIEPERESLQSRSGAAQAGLDAAKLRGKTIESERKKLELDVEAKKTQIEKYALQQFQTKKNEEYRALGAEMDHCRAAIRQLEDQQLELMEQAEDAQRQLVVATGESNEAKKRSDEQFKILGEREANLKKELQEIEATREQLTSGISENVLSRYSRLLKAKGGTAVVGIDHGVCGGCHMKFPIQLTVQCQAEKELVNCPNCGRILYYTGDMDMAAAE
jgi:predicted  nucleic acid-binding Zn-ribbon protein